MSILMQIFIAIYCLGLFGLGLWLLIDGTDTLCDVFNKRESEININDWIKTIWIVILWPLSLFILYIFKGIKPTLIFLKDAIIFILKFLLYPFNILFSYIKPLFKTKKNKEPFRDKLGKFIVKVFKL